MQNNNGNYGKQRNWQNNNSLPAAELPEGYLNGGYYADKEKKELKKEYIVKYSKHIAKSLDDEGGRDINKRSQLRKFYEYVIRVEKSVFYSEHNFERYEADLWELLPHVEYAKSRKVVSDIFVKFIKKNLDNIHDEKDLKAFSRHFESIVAYTKKDN